ncbi:ribokinase [Chloroflexota bacterium]
MSARISVVGSLNMDLVIRSPHIPQPGETIIGSDFQTIPGGKGANQAVAAARLGGEVSMVGRVGNDAFADVLLDNLTAAEVDTSFIQRDETAASGAAMIVVDDNGENIIVVASGANLQLSETDVERAEQVIAASDVLVLQLEVPLPVVTRAAQIAQAHQVAVVLNPAPARELPLELLELVDVLVPNESETALLTGLPIGSQVELEQAANKLLSSGIGYVVITLGGRGAFLASPDYKSKNFEAFSIQPVDTTAAGDAFVAGLAVNYGAGKTLPDAIRWGNAAGAMAALRFGAQSSLPTRNEVLKLIKGEKPDSILGRTM